MAEQEYLVKGSTLTGIANAIRSKTGIPGSFPVNTFATKINSISETSASANPTFEGLHWDEEVISASIQVGYGSSGDICLSVSDFFSSVPEEGSKKIVLLFLRTSNLQDFSSSIDGIPFLVWDFFNNTFDVINSTGNVARASHTFSTISPLEDDYFTLVEGDEGREFPFVTDVGTIDEGLEVIGITISW